MQVNRKRQRRSIEEGPAPKSIDNDVKDLLSKQLDTNLLSRKGVEFCREGDIDQKRQGDTIPVALTKEDILRYPGGVTKLAHLAVQKKVCLSSSDSPTVSSKSTSSPLPSTSVPGTSQDHASSLALLPRPLVERHRLTLAEIRALPRFGKYDPGTPAKTLYIKNLHHRVSRDDLISLFGHYSSSSSECIDIKVKLLTGKMRGQAFVEFKSVSVAVDALEFANGYPMYGKPLVISYGKQKQELKQQ